jgi:hypothetical protein
MKRFAALLGVLALVAAAALFACATPSSQRTRLVAVADVHGAHDRFVALLRAAQLVDANAHWSGGKAVLVQLGDTIDRGPDDRRVLDLLMRVVVLLGNHEVMNLHGDLRYVSKESYASFATPSSQALDEKPLGYAEHREAFGPTGVYGRWLRRRPFVAIVSDVAFVHGGLVTELAARGAERVNEAAHAQLARFDEARAALVARRPELALAELDALTAAAGEELTKSDLSESQRKLLGVFAQYPTWLCAHPSGPVWFRGYARWDDGELDAKLPAILEGLGVRRIVVGHTPNADGRIHVRANGAVVLADTGLLGPPFYRNGIPTALEVVGNQLFAIDVEGTRTRIAGHAETVIETSATAPHPAAGFGVMQRSSLSRFFGSATIAKNSP